MIPPCNSLPLHVLRGLCMAVLASHLAPPHAAFAQQSIATPSVPVAQNFDGLGSSATATLPVGWRVGTDWTAGATATTLAYGTSGAGVVTSTSSGGIVNWANGVTASSTSRALGFLNTGSFTSPRSIVYAFQNDTGATVTSLTVNWTYEKYRSGTRAWNWTFFHGDTSSASTPAIDGDQAYPGDIDNATAFNPPTVTAKVVTITGLSIPSGGVYYLRWTLTGVGGSSNGQGLGINDFSITLGASSVPSVTVSPSSLFLPTTTQGSNGISTNFTARGNLLSTNIAVTAVNSNDFAISTNNINFTNTLTLPTNSSGAVTNTLVYVRLTGKSAGSPSNVISLASGTNSASVGASGTVDPPPVQPAITVSTNALPGFSSLIGVASSITNFTAGGSNLTTNIDVVAPAGFSIAFSTNNADFTNTLTLTNTSGSASNRIIHVRMDAFGSPTNIALTNISLTTSSGAPKTVSVSGTVLAPQITLSTNSLSGFSAFAGSSSTNQSFTAGGSNLVAPIVLTASNGYEISTNQTSGFGTTVSLGGSGGGTIASDNGGNYSSATWTNGANAGTGFLPWAIRANSGGGFIGNPSSAGIGGMSSNSFGLFANPTNSGNFVDADRSFSAPLAVGQTFSFQWGINWDSDSVGNKGFNIYAGEPGTNQLVNVNNAGSGDITINGTNTGLAFGTNAMTWSFTLTSSNSLSVSATGRDGVGSFSTNLTTGVSAPKSIRFYASQLPSGGDNRQPYFNNLLISAPSSGPATNFVAPTTIYVRISATNSANPALLGGITVATTGATNSPQVSLSGEVKALPSIPTLNTLQPFLAVSGQASPAQQLTVVGANLTNPLTVVLPQFFQVSTNGTGGPYQGSPLVLSNTNSAGGLNTPVWLRVGSNAPITAGLVATNLVLSSGSAMTNLAVSYRVNSPNPSLAVTPTNLPAILSTQGSPSSGSFLLQGSTLSAGVTNTASSPFLVSTSSGGPFVGNLTVPISSGLVSTNIFVQVATNTPPGVYSGNVAAASGTNTASVAVVASVIASGGAPQIVVSTNALTNFYTFQGFPSTNQTFLAAGYNLTNTTITVGVAGSDYEISTNGSVFTSNVTLAASAGQVPPTQIWARLSTNAVVGSNVSSAISLVSGSASNSVALSGRVDPLRPPSVTLVSPSNNPTIIEPGAKVNLVATVVDTNVAGGPGTLSSIEFLADGVPIPGAATNNVVSPATLTFTWMPGTLPAEVSARAVDSDGLVDTSSAVTVRYPFEGEPVVGFSPPSANGTVQAVAPSAGAAFYIGGEFTELNAEPVARVARVLADGEVDPEFSAGTGPNGAVRALLELDGGLLVGGSFSIVDGVARAGLAKLSLAGRIDTAFNAAFTAGAKVNVVVSQYDGQLLVGGQFTASVTTEEGQNGQPVTRTLSNLVRLDPDTGAIDPDFRPNPNGEVNAVAVQPDGKILVGGSFGTIAASSRTRLARLHLENPDPSDPMALLDATFVTGSGPSGPVQSIAVLSGGSIVVGGQFSTYNGSGNYLNLLKLGPSGTLDPVFNFSGRPQQPTTGGFNGAVFDVHVRPSGHVLASGAFTRVENRSLQIPFNEPAGRVVQLRPDGYHDPSFNPGGAGANNTVLRSATLANGNLVLVGAFDRFNDKEVQRIVVLAGANGLDPMVVSAPFLTVPAGQEFAFNFRSSTGAGARFELDGEDPLPVGMSFDPDGLLTGIPLQAGGLRFRVTPSAGGRQGLASDFELYVLPRMVPFSVWQRVWYPGQEDEPDVAGPDVSSGNPSGLSNFLIYALSGGDPRQSGAGILPVAVPTPEPDDGPVYLTLYSPFYPLAEARFLIEYSDDLRGSWIGVPTSVDPDLGILSGRAPQPMEGSARQFLRLQVAPLPTNE